MSLSLMERFPMAYARSGALPSAGRGSSQANSAGSSGPKNDRA